MTGSNRRPSACKADALPAELILHLMVTRTGFEPVYACVKGMCVKPLHQRAIKSFNGAPKRSRTPNLLIRSQTLYPIELWALFMLFLMMLIRHSLWCGREDSNLHRIAPTSPSSWRVYHSATTAYSLFMAHHNEINGAGEENRTLTVSLEG